MKKFNVPTRNEVTPDNQAIFDNLEKAVGFLPNLYATYAHNDTALSDYLALANRKTSLSAQEKEIVNLVVSQVNDCAYCLAAHTAIGKMNGFTNHQILEIRSGRASFNSTFDALAQYVKDATENRSKPSSESIANLFSAGYTKAEVIDIIMLIGDKTISNYLHGTTQVPVDFPAAAAL
jgi:uncharacterized peroxidase-related enzyme